MGGIGLMLEILSEPRQKSRDVGSQRLDRVAAFHHYQGRKAERCRAGAEAGVICCPQGEVADRVAFPRVRAEAHDQ